MVADVAEMAVAVVDRDRVFLGRGAAGPVGADGVHNRHPAAASPCTGLHLVFYGGDRLACLYRSSCRSIPVTRSGNHRQVGVLVREPPQRLFYSRALFVPVLFMVFRGRLGKRMCLT